MPKLYAASVLKAFQSAGATTEAAEQAAADIGWLTKELSGLTGRVNLVIALLLVMLTLLAINTYRLGVTNGTLATHVGHDTAEPQPPE